MTFSVGFPGFSKKAFPPGLKASLPCPTPPLSRASFSPLSFQFGTGVRFENVFSNPFSLPPHFCPPFTSTTPFLARWRNAKLRVIPCPYPHLPSNTIMRFVGFPEDDFSLRRFRFKFLLPAPPFHYQAGFFPLPPQSSFFLKDSNQDISLS